MLESGAQPGAEYLQCPAMTQVWPLAAFVMTSALCSQKQRMRLHDSLNAFALPAFGCQTARKVAPRLECAPTHLQLLGLGR